MGGSGLDNGAQRGAVTPRTVPFCVGPSPLGHSPSPALSTEKPGGNAAPRSLALREAGGGMEVGDLLRARVSPLPISIVPEGKLLAFGTSFESK